MHEIVIVRSIFFEKGCPTSPRVLPDKQEPNQLWWFDGKYTARDLALALNDGDSKMPCDAILFTFEFVPNLRGLEHFQPSSSYMADDFEFVKGVDLFEEDLPELVKIVKRKISESDYAPWYADTDFYALYEVETDVYRDEDGGVDDVQVIPTLLGEIDPDKLALALINKESEVKP